MRKLKMKNIERNELLKTFEQNKLPEDSKSKKRSKKFIFSFILIFLIFGFVTNEMELNRKEQERQEALRIETEQREREIEEAKAKEAWSKESVQNWIEYNDGKISANYDQENKVMYVSYGFGRTQSIEKRIKLANINMYDTLKELESNFKGEIETYMFNFEASVVDKYGNESTDVVYSSSFIARDISPVNWNGISVDQLMNLSNKIYKSIALYN